MPHSVRRFENNSRRRTETSTTEKIRAPRSDKPTIYSIGHSTRTIGEFVGILRAAEVDKIVDVRSLPGSRSNPQFNADALAKSLADAKIGYRHIPELGGLRHHRAAAPSRNTLWRNDSFRSYADYAETEPFRNGLDLLLGCCRKCVCAMMCAEAVWWRCHRRIIADYLLARGIRVIHIMGAGKFAPATITPGAIVQRSGSIIYPASPNTEEEARIP